MVDNVQPRSLSCFRIRKRRHENRNGSTKSEHPRASQHDLGWRARRTTSLLPVAGVVFSLDSPLYRTWAGERGEQHRSFQSPGLFFLLTLPFIELGLES